MVRAPPHLKRAASLHSQPGVLDTSVTPQSAGEGWRSQDGRQGGRRAVAKQPLVHQLPLASLLLPAQRGRLGGDVRRHDGQHAVLHVLQDATPQLRRQCLDEGDGIQGRVSLRGLLG